MFEYHKTLVKTLLEENTEFRELYEQHRELDEITGKADSGVLPLDDLALHRMKKEKLLIRDKLANLIAQFGPDTA